MMWLWFALAVAFLVIELITTQLISIWFAVAALITGVVKAIYEELSMTWQIVMFVVISAVLVAVSRPLVKKFFDKGDEAKTNMDLKIGKVVHVTETINAIEDTGLVKIDGIVWSARTSDNSVIEEGKLVKVDSFNGNKVIVSLVDEKVAEEKAESKEEPKEEVNEEPKEEIKEEETK